MFASWLLLSGILLLGFLVAAESGQASTLMVPATMEVAVRRRARSLFPSPPRSVSILLVAAQVSPNYFSATCPEGCRSVDIITSCGSLSELLSCNMAVNGDVSLSCQDGSAYSLTTAGCAAPPLTPAPSVTPYPPTSASNQSGAPTYTLPPSATASHAPTTPSPTFLPTMLTNASDFVAVFNRFGSTVARALPSGKHGSSLEQKILSAIAIIVALFLISSCLLLPPFPIALAAVVSAGGIIGFIAACAGHVVLLPDEWGYLVGWGAVAFCIGAVALRSIRFRRYPLGFATSLMVTYTAIAVTAGVDRRIGDDATLQVWQCAVALAAVILATSAAGASSLVAACGAFGIVFACVTVWGASMAVANSIDPSVKCSLADISNPTCPRTAWLIPPVAVVALGVIAIIGQRRVLARRALRNDMEARLSGLRSMRYGAAEEDTNRSLWEDRNASMAESMNTNA